MYIIKINNSATRSFLVKFFDRRGFYDIIINIMIHTSYFNIPCYYYYFYPNNSIIIYIIKIYDDISTFL